MLFSTAGSRDSINDLKDPKNDESKSRELRSGVAD